MSRRSFGIGLATLAVLTLAACGGATSSAPTGPSQATSACQTAAADADFAADITVKDFAPDKPAVTIKAGETVRWTNQDSATHAFAVDGHSDCATASLPQGAIGKITFLQAGTYTYHCTIHASMKDYTVTVTAG